MKKRKRYRSISARKRRIQLYQRAGLILLAVLVIFGIAYKGIQAFQSSRAYEEIPDGEILAEKPDIDVQLLDINAYSRPGEQSGKINGIVIHYTANPGSTAQQNRDYFNGLQESHETKASSHFVVGLDGEIIQCVPTWEIAYASNNRNEDTVSVECCHPDESGEFNEKTYRSVVQLTAWLCEKFQLTSSDVIRHYDITGKICPKYFVEHEEAWQKFLGNVQNALDQTNLNSG